MLLGNMEKVDKGICQATTSQSHHRIKSKVTLKIAFDLIIQNIT